MIVITGLKEKHINYIIPDNGKELARQLAHVYHFYLHGIKGKKSKLKFCNMVCRYYPEAD